MIADARRDLGQAVRGPARCWDPSLPVHCMRNDLTEGERRHVDALIRIIFAQPVAHAAREPLGLIADMLGRQFHG